MADTLFITGRLAEPALRGVVSALEIDHQIAVMNISVAALMTTRWIAKRVSDATGAKPLFPREQSDEWRME